MKFRELSTSKKIEVQMFKKIKQRGRLKGIPEAGSKMERSVGPRKNWRGTVM